MNDLFRPESVSYAWGRLKGDVVLATPLSARFLGLLLAAVVFVVVAFAAWGSYARKAAVTGWLVPDIGFIRATAPTAGLITAVMVKDGDQVAQGQRLAEIKVAIDIANGNVGDAVVNALRSAVEAQKARGEARIAKLEAEATQTTTRLRNLKPELVQVRQQTQLQEQRISLAQEAVASTEQLATAQLITQRELEQRRSTALAAEQDLAAERRQIASIEREMADLEARLAAIPIDIALVRAETQSEQASLNQRMSEAEQRRAIYVLAPTAGKVAAIPVTNGQAIAAGGTLAVMIPSGGRLEAELLTPSRAIGFIETGQSVYLKLQAYPFERYGVVNGTVKSISTTVLGPSEIAIPGLTIQEPVFRIRVALSREAVDAYGKSYPLQPGMLLSADIVFDRRSLLQWLFDPIYAVGRRL